MTIASLSRRVFSCFHRFEAFFDRLTGRVGPLFVTFCAALLFLGTTTYFEVYFPTIFWYDEASLLWKGFGLLLSIYLVVNIAFHYHSAVTILPGSPHDPVGTVRTRAFFTWGNDKHRAEDHTRRSNLGHDASGGDEDAAPVAARREERLKEQARAQTGSARVCKKCPLQKVVHSTGDVNALDDDDDADHQTWRKPPKPERAHHCSVCETCWLKFDHHCPWINGCVGLYNERYFLLFMVYLSVACACVSVLGLPVMLSSVLNHSQAWSYYTPQVFAVLLWILCAAMAFALGVMSVWQLWLIRSGESTVEANDNAYYRKLATHKGRTFLNPYDLGAKQNIYEFFNLERHSAWTILLPVRVPPSSDGWRWRKRSDWEAHRIEEDEELTDDEDAPNVTG